MTHDFNARDLTGPGNLLVGANYHPHDSDPATWRRDAKTMQDAGLRIVRLGHLAWDTFEPADDDFRFEWFDECMDLMREHGIGVILDIAVRPAPLWLHRKHPTIGVVDPDGTRLLPQPPLHRGRRRPPLPANTRCASPTRSLNATPASGARGVRHRQRTRRRTDLLLPHRPRPLHRLAEDQVCHPRALNAAWAGQRWSRRISDFDEIGLPGTRHRQGRRARAHPGFPPVRLRRDEWLSPEG